MSGSTISTSITAAVTLGSSGYQPSITITNTGEINATTVPNATDGAQGSRAIYAATSLPSGTVQNDGRLIGGIGYITGGTGVYLYGHDRLSNSGVILGGYSTDGFDGGGGSGVYLAAQEGASLTNAGTIAGGNGKSMGGDALDVGTSGNFFFYPDRFSVDSTLAGVVFNNGLLVGGTGETDTVDSDGSGSFTFGGNGGLGVFLGAGTLDNKGTIAGGSGKQAGGNGVDVYGAFGATLINNGTISGGLGIGGTIADAVLFGAATVASTLVVDPGAGFIGAVGVAGSAPDMILLGAGTVQAPGTLDMGGSFSGFDTISFEPGTAWQLTGDAAELAEGQVIDRFALRDTIILSGFTAMTHGYIEGAGLELSNGTVTETLDIVGSFSTGSFAVSDTSQGTEILLCHLRGTRIATPAGEVAVEALKIGDAVITRFGGYRRIKWIGRQSFGARFIRGNRNKVPVRIKAGALGGSLPRRDLFVSPGHSLLLGGALILARDLVNGVTVTQNDRVDDVHYYHIEFETHDCLLAEGVWSESFCDYAELRGQFHNATEFWSHYPTHVTQTEHLMCAPRPEAGPALAAALYPVAARAAALATPGPLRGCIDEVSPTGLIRGWAQDIASPELPVLLNITLGTCNVGTILACDHRQDLTNAGIGTGRASFNFHGPHLTPDQRADIVIRRAADGASLDAGTGRYHERAA